MAGRQAASHNTGQVARIGSPEIWREIAALADEFGVSFERLLQRYEERKQDVPEIRRRLQRGQVTRENGRRESVLIPPTAEWLTSEQAQSYLPGIVDAVFKTGITPDRIKRSKNATSARGGGWLWKRRDLERVGRIQAACNVRVRDALRIMDAIERARPNGIDSDDWLTTIEAREIIPSILHSAAHCSAAVRRKPAGRVPQRNGWLWHKGDITHVRAIMDACGIKSRVALRAVSAQKRGEI